jgi:hypothetical protein
MELVSELAATFWLLAEEMFETTATDKKIPLRRSTR